MDRGISYEILEKYMIAHKEYNYVCMYETGKRICQEIEALSNTSIEQFENVFYTDDLNQAVSMAKKITPKGYGCVLSPAAASYGYFKNFEERGDVFKSLVKA